MQLESLVTMRRLVFGTATTTAGAATCVAADMAQAVAAEPTWLNMAVKFGTLAAAAVTALAGLFKIYFDCKREAREVRAELAKCGTCREAPDCEAAAKPDDINA